MTSWLQVLSMYNVQVCVLAEGLQLFSLSLRGRSLSKHKRSSTVLAEKQAKRQGPASCSYHSPISLTHSLTQSSSSSHDSSLTSSCVNVTSNLPLLSVLPNAPSSSSSSSPSFITPWREGAKGASSRYNLGTGYGVPATRRNGFCHDAAWEDESCSRVMCGWWRRRAHWRCLIWGSYRAQE